MRRPFSLGNDVAKRLGKTVSDPRTSGVTDPSAASVGVEMSVPSAEEARVIREVQAAWDNVMSAIKEESVGWFLGKYRTARARRGRH